MGNSQATPAAAATKYKWDEIKKHNTKADAWIVVRKNVYNVTKFLGEHPGGPDILIENSGKDASQNHTEANHSQDAVEMMKDFLIGVLDEVQ
jgi:cytochrome-b5 reductase